MSHFENPVRVWHVHLRPAADRADVLAFCLRQGLVDVGWGVDALPTLPVTIESYLEAARATYEEKTFGRCEAAVGALARQVSVGDLVWTRDKHRVYWLGLVCGPWEYRDTKSTRDVNILNVRPVRWVLVGEESKVPAKIASHFFDQHTVRSIKWEGAELASLRAYARASADAA